MSQVFVCCIAELGLQLEYVMTLVIQFPQFGCVILNVLLQLQIQELDVNSTRGEAMHAGSETENSKWKSYDSMLLLQVFYVKKYNHIRIPLWLVFQHPFWIQYQRVAVSSLFHGSIGHRSTTRQQRIDINVYIQVAS